MISEAENRRPRTVSVYAVHADSVRGMDWEPVRERMPKRMERAGRYRLERDRLLCVGGGLLLIEVVGIRDESELRYGEFGRPYAPGYPDFNLSHSGEWCVLAMGEAEIGVDIERVDGDNLRVAPLVCTEGEREWMEADPLDRFHVLWTWKESLMKATGLGLNLNPADFEVLPFHTGAPVALGGRTWHGASGALGDYRYGACASYPMRVDFRRWP